MTGRSSFADKIAVFHPGTQHSWQTALALQQLGRLQFYATSIFYQPDRWPYRIERMMPSPIREKVHYEFRRFSSPALDTNLVKTVGVSEWIERLAHRAGFRQLSRRIDQFGNARFAELLKSEMESSRSFDLWGYSSSSVHAFRAAKAAGRACILDRTIGDGREHNRIMDDLHETYPEFFSDSSFRIPADRIERDDEEYSLADVILTGSPFAADSVRKHASDGSVGDRLRVLNYCFDERLFGGFNRAEDTPRSGPVRFLFLGQAGVRKGIHLVLKVFEKIPRELASVQIVGDMLVPKAIFSKYSERVSYQPTVPRADVPSIMRNADVLIFPSYFEGSALVLLEAMASGLALIQSKNAGVAVTPETGIMLPELTEEALQSAVMEVISNRERLASFKANAQREAQKYTFARYRSSIESLLEGPF
ncbi:MULTISPECIES: glycosyltransferase family 4 protein [unclassified Bradyrhizobium]|uniref:glycosyltransferase family 4 protein n=1 Tax=unclassified Bradyrhizobium TaxID=2631580 RepID=UPI0023065009|nr:MULTISPECIES: glycosyltransferase family 4 protein [unclassified Bradyrhizobium]